MVAGLQPHPRLRAHRGFKSRFLPGERDLTVYLPPGYEQQPQRRFPVLYLHDGQNLFDPQTAFVAGQCWRVREHADEEIHAGRVEPLLIVGIGNAGERRLAEYTHSRDQKLGGGEAELYGKLIRRELMPFIDSGYRTLAGRRHTGMGGSSLGGLVSLYLGLQHADVFGRLAALSPSVWWDHKSIAGFVDESAKRLPERPRTWLDVGSAEGPRTLADARLLRQRLLANGWIEGETLRYEEARGGTHDEAAWSERVAPMLRFLFPASATGAAGAGPAAQPGK